MDNKEVKITFLPDTRSVFVLPGTRVLEAALRAEIIPDTSCGGKGTCGKCRVDLLVGSVQDAAGNTLEGAGDASVSCLACQARVRSDCTIRIARAARMTGMSILSDDDGRPAELDRNTEKYFIQEQPSDIAGQENDLAKITRHISGPVTPDLAFLQQLPRFLRDNGFTGTFTVTGGRLIAAETGDTTGRCFGIAVDIGTTTLAVALVDMADGTTAASAGAQNPQSEAGADVISRIDLSSREPEAVARLQGMLITRINELVAGLCSKTGTDPDHIYEAAVTGNAVMLHFFLGVTPQYLGTLPFAPAVQHSTQVPARELGLAIHPAGEVWVFPSIAGFVGGDTVACILAAGLRNRKGNILLVDIGTNGEIVVTRDGRLSAASTAAGPAFEGAKISAGMRAVPGAVEKVVFRAPEVVYNVIGNETAAGLCGSGLIDTVAELVRHGVVDETGRMLEAEELNSGEQDYLKGHLGQDDAGTVFTVTGKVMVTQRDIRELQLGKGAIHAGSLLLMRKHGLDPAGLDEVLLAGGFGNFIRRSNAVCLGLVPDVSHDRIRYIGNAALTGAKMALLSCRARKEADRIAGSCDFVELATDPGFQMQFAESMMFTRPEHTSEHP